MSIKPAFYQYMSEDEIKPVKNIEFVKFNAMIYGDYVIVPVKKQNSIN